MRLGYAKLVTSNGQCSELSLLVTRTLPVEFPTEKPKRPAKVSLKARVVRMTAMSLQAVKQVCLNSTVPCSTTASGAVHISHTSQCGMNPKDRMGNFLSFHMRHLD